MDGTCEGRADHRGNSLEHEQQPERICQLVKTKEIHEHHTGQTDIGAAGDSEDGAVDDLPSVRGHEAAEAHGDAAEDEAGVVEVEPVDEAPITEPAKEEATKCVGDADDGEKERGVFLGDFPATSSVHCVHIGHVEPDACEEVGDGVHQEDGIFEEGEVDHLLEHPRVLAADVAAQHLGLLLASAQLTSLSSDLPHRPSVRVRVVPARSR